MTRLVVTLLCLLLILYRLNSDLPVYDPDRLDYTLPVPPVTTAAVNHKHQPTSCTTAAVNHKHQPTSCYNLSGEPQAPADLLCLDLLMVCAPVY